MGSALDLAPAPRALLLPSQLERRRAGDEACMAAAGRHAARLRLSRLRRHAEQSRAVCAAAPFQDRHAQRPALGVARIVAAIRGGRSGRMARRQRDRARAALGTAVRGSGAPLHRRAARRSQGLARGRRRPVRRTGARDAARATRASAGPSTNLREGRAVALGARAALYATARPAADAISRALAPATAAQQLLSGGKSLAAVADAVGYESEAAFNRAFKREFGLPPASWRTRQERQAGLAP